MTELQWTPAMLGQLTLPQLVCLLNERPPGAADKFTTFEEREAYFERRRAAEREWSHRP